MLRVCVIGLGPIGNLHSRLYLEDPNAQLVGVCDINAERAKAAGEKYGVPYFLSAPEMLSALQPDLCSVATGGYEYGSDHFEPTMQALDAGCHVLCEKPICNDIEKAKQMVALAARNKRCFGVDFNHRFAPPALHAKRWLDEGRIGTLLFCNMALWIGKFGEFSEFYHLKALNPHSVNMMQYYCGPVARVQCFGARAPGRTLISTASINMQFENGVVGHLTSSYDIARGHPMERCEVAGTKGRMLVKDMWREAVLYPADDDVKQVYTNPVFGGYRDFDDTFRARLHAFTAQVAAGAAPEDINGSGLDGLNAQRVIEAAIRSYQRGEIVEVGEV